jgi:bifunctional enzyme CysN/CysC
VSTRARGADTEVEPRLTRIVVVGHVDHGKSTLVGRLLHDVGALPLGKVDAVKEMCRRRGMPFEWAFVTDALQAERDQGVTIDASYARFAVSGRRFVLTDAPGHRQFIRNMISGAAGADGALVVIDATQGVGDQSRRHAHLLHLLGVRRTAVAITKMDLLDYDAARYSEVECEFRGVADALGLDVFAAVPVSAKLGDNVATRAATMAWYGGPTLLEALQAMEPALPGIDLPLRIVVQDIYKFDERRIIAGRVESGRVRGGDTLLFSPSNQAATVRSIETWPPDASKSAAAAGDAVGLTLAEQIFVERGEIASHAEGLPIETNVFRARVFWLGERPLTQGSRYVLRLNAAQAAADVVRLESVYDPASMASQAADELPCDHVGDAILRTRAMLALDPATANARTGRFVLVENESIVGGGLVDMRGYPDQRPALVRKATNVSRVEHRVTHEMRGARNGHGAGVVWLTGLSAAGKSTLAIEAEARLFRKGYQVYVLDGDNLRHGLNADLGFAPADRAENVRRVGELAALLARAGFVVITAFISPYRADRERARRAAGGRFHEVYIAADLETCERRDPRGLYKKARSGEIVDFTGVSAPYEPPESCELAIDTAALSVEESVVRLVRYVEAQFPLKL